MKRSQKLKDFVQKLKKKKISARKTVFTSFIVDILDIIFNFIVAIMTGSMVMIAETLQGFADVIMDLFLIIGLRLGRNGEDREHSFGHGKEIYFWVLLASLVMIFLTAGLTLYFGIRRFILPEIVERIFLAYIILSIGVISNAYAFSVSFRRVLNRKNPKKIVDIFKNSDLIASKTTFIADLIGTSSSFLGLLALILYSVTGDLRFDALGAIVIGLVLLFLSFMLLKNAKEFLIGKSVSKNLEDEMKKAALEIDEVKDVLELKTMYIGLEKVLVNIDVHLEDDLDTDTIEEIIDKIQYKIKKRVPKVVNVQVELETPGKE